MASELTLMLSGAESIAPPDVTVPAPAAKPASQEIFEAAASHYMRCLWDSSGARFYQVAKRRHDQEVLKRAKIGLTDGKLTASLMARGFSQEELENSGLVRNGRDYFVSGVFIYPMMDTSGRVSGFRIKDPRKKYNYQLPASKRLNGVLFFGEQTLSGVPDDAPLLLVEGENDWLSCIEAGWQGAALATGGQPSRAQRRWIKDNCSGREVVTLFDCDHAGDRYRKEFANLELPQLRQYLVQGAKDADELLKRQEQDGATMQWLLANCQEWSEENDQAAQDSRIQAEGQWISDRVNAELLIDWLAGRALYVEDLKQWAWYEESGIWRFDAYYDVESVSRRLGPHWKRKADRIIEEANERGGLSEDEAKVVRRLLGEAKAKESANGVRAVLAYTEGLLRRMSSAFDADPWLLGVKNGVINLRDLTFRDTHPDDLLTMSCDAAYDESAICPRWLEFLATAVDGGDPIEAGQMLRYLQMVAGLVLIGVPLERAFFFVYGPPASGKSIFTNTLRRLLGTYAEAVSPDTMMASRIGDTDIKLPEIVALRGKRLAVAAECSDGSRFNDELIKRFTGNDPIKARALYKNPVEFMPQTTLFFTGNDRPLSSSGGKAFWDRLKVIPFRNSIPAERQDRDLQRKLYMELNGILQWALEGLRQYIMAGRLEDPDAVRAELESYRRELDTLQLFLDDCCELSAEDFVPVAELYKVYCQFCKDNGYSLMSSKTMSQRLTNGNYRGLSRVRRRYERGGNPKYCVLGIRLKYRQEDSLWDRGLAPTSIRWTDRDAEPDNSGGDA